MEPSSKRLRSCDTTSQVADGIAIFDVGGRLFKVLRQTVEARPSTLLATILDDLGTDGSQPIFIDANPDRFGYILDWYRYGEMHVPTQGFPIAALLRDARFFLLPDTVKINGVSYCVQPSLVEEVRNETISSTISGWPNFEQCLQGMISDVKEHFKALGAEAARVQKQPDGSYERQSFTRGHVDAGVCKKLDLPKNVFPPKEFRLSVQEIRTVNYLVVSWFRWLEPENVGSKGRLYVLIDEFEKRGFSYDLKDSATEIVLRVGLHFDFSPARQQV